MLYDMLLSSGGFADYRTESNVLNLLEPRFGNLANPTVQGQLLDAWFGCRLGTLSGLDRPGLEVALARECRNGGDFLRIVMESIAQRQGAWRWADTTPEHLLFLDRIKETIPNALIIHVIRDGRDVALSTARQGWIRKLRFDSLPNVMACAMYWEWIVNRGRAAGRHLGRDYMEVRFERLVSDPHTTLGELGGFIEHDLDYDKIRLRSRRIPNSSFRNEEKTNFNPIERWRRQLSSADLDTLEQLVGGTLTELGYALGGSPGGRTSAFLATTRTLYRAFFDAKRFLKAQTPAGRWLVTRDLSWI